MNSEPKMNFQNPLDLINFVLEERLHRARKSILESEISIQLPEDFLDSLLQNRETSGPIFYLSETKAKSIITCKNQNSFPEMVEYERDATDFWHITSIKKTCLGCFGTGILSDIEICSVCSGEGWTEF
jgi:DnaJ-class molecular chaperone